MIKIAIILFLGLALTSAVLSDVEEWQQFKSLHKKLYQSQEEETHRFEIFQGNLKKIREHNEKYEKGESSFKMGVNQFSDLTAEEFKEIYGRGVLPPKDGNKPAVYA